MLEIYCYLLLVGMSGVKSKYNIRLEVKWGEFLIASFISALEMSVAHIRVCSKGTEGSLGLHLRTYIRSNFSLVGCHRFNLLRIVSLGLKPNW